jgi:hypothetical protein
MQHNTIDMLAAQLDAAQHRNRDLEAALRAAQGEVQALKLDREFSMMLAEGIGTDLSPV